MSTSESKTPWYGNADRDQRFPQTNEADKKNFIYSVTPVRRIQVGKQTQILAADALARVQIFAPDDHERLKHPARSKNGAAKTIFEARNSQWVLIHDPSGVAVEAPTSEQKVVEEPKRKRRTKAEIEADAAAAPTGATDETVSDTGKEGVEDAGEGVE